MTPTGELPPAPRRRPRPLRRREPARSRLRRVLHAASTVLIVAGTLVVVDAVVTLLWQEPITAFFTHRTQTRLGREFDALRAAGPTAGELAVLADIEGERGRIAFLAASLRRRSHEGDPVGRIRIPRIGAGYVVVAGSTTDALRKGPGFYTGMRFPGERGTSAIAGHRTTYLAPFRHIDELRAGDEIVVEMPYATFTYRVAFSRIVEPDDLSVLSGPGDRLVLTACHPLFSASHRIAVSATLVRTSVVTRTTHHSRVGRLSERLKRSGRRPDGLREQGASPPTITPAPAQ